jgi:hypothetical protein
MKKRDGRGTAIEIVFGAMAPPILDQLRAQGIRASILSSVDALQFQKDADAVVRLAVRGILPENAKRAAHRRILRRMIAEIEAAAREARPGIIAETRPE